MFKKIIAKQFRKPDGLLGNFCAKLMDKGNLLTINWVFSLLDIKDGDKILEIGYGSGILINKIANLNKNNLIHGIDFSTVMHKRASKNCKDYIASNDVKLFYGDLIDFKNDILFDKIIAINVVYFWKDITVYLDYINKLLNNKGKIYLYFSDPKELEKIKFTRTDIFNKYSEEDIIKALKKSNFKNIIIKTDKTNIDLAHCAIAEK